MNLQRIETKIYEFRGVKVMLDFDLAELYQTETKRLKEAVRRNILRFPTDFMFKLTTAEYKSLRTQIASLERGRGRYSKFLPFAFTEQGVAMLSGVLNSTKAIKVNIQIIRAFVLLREFALSHKDLTLKLRRLERKYNRRFKDVEHALTYLLNKDNLESMQKERKRIGYKTQD